MQSSSYNQIEVQTISAINAVGFTTITENSYVEINTNEQCLVSIQLVGTWSVATGGFYPQVTLNGVDWITINNPYGMLEIANMDFDSYIASGRTGIWQIDVTGYTAFRLVAIGTTLTGTPKVQVQTSPNVRNIITNTAGLPFVKFLTTNGDGTGTNNLTGNYSSSSTDFYYQPTSTQKFYIHQVIIQLSDATKFSQVDYGGTTTLTNGVKFYINQNGTEIPLISGFAFKSNEDYFALTPHILLTTFAGTADTMCIQFDVEHDFGLPLMLDGAENTKFIVRLNDNFTSLTSHRFSLRGRLV
jgi:hypothetical protein